MHIANSDVVLEANRRIAKAEEERKKTLQHKKEKDARKLDRESVTAYERLKSDGKLYADGKPVLKPDEAKVILRSLLPKIGDGKEVISNYNSGVKCLKRLMAVAEGDSGKTWETEMDSVVAEVEARSLTSEELQAFRTGNSLF